MKLNNHSFLFYFSLYLQSISHIFSNLITVNSYSHLHIQHRQDVSKTIEIIGSVILHSVIQQLLVHTFSGLYLLV